ncbi:MAG: hypothetical protein ACYC23_09315 [Limisphaerales bacterium]
MPAQAQDKSKRLAGDTNKATTYYTQFSLFHEGLNHRTTNYRKGILVPANTPVTVVKTKKKHIVVKLPDGTDLTIENVQKYSGEGIDRIFLRTFSAEKVDLSKFTDAERSAISSGSIETGMTKAAVLVALGYPPKHKTPSLESNQWRYWQNRFNTFVLHFKEGKVAEIQN